MTVPPTGGIPGIPGGTGWAGPQQPAGAPPVFVSPQPTYASTEQFELAGWGSRFGAFLVDWFLRVLIAVVVPLVLFALIADDPFSIPAGWDESDDMFLAGTTAGDYNLFWLLGTMVLGYVVAGIFYAPLFMDRWRGATPGKKLVGIRVVHEGGADLTLGQAFVREPLVKGLLINTIGGSFGLVPLVSYLWPLWDRECRAGHDFIVKTRVVRAR
ncbi:MAG: RDD family protein [Solirubrobacteraceae bacterium]|nr:RDD family protein [Solirubrobacteraceae bacterium]